MKVSDTIGMHFDLIIANTPYGSTGANITKNIIKHVTFNQFINLLPANDYKRVDDLHQHVRNMEAISDGFADATVTTHLCEVVKEASDMTVEEFEIAQYIDPQLDKYFTKNIYRTFAVDYIDPSGTHPDTWKLDKTLLIGWRYIANKHLPYTKEVETYAWNVLEKIDQAQFFDSKNKQRARAKGKYELCYFAYTFKTAVEKKNIVNFLYSHDGFRLISKVFTAENLDGGTEYHVAIALPRVDWTRAWTVEEILEDYGYTETEIAEVMADLENFKDMER
jgi:hypothetical protein